VNQQILGSPGFAEYGLPGVPLYGSLEKNDIPGLFGPDFKSRQGCLLAFSTPLGAQRPDHLPLVLRQRSAITVFQPCKEIADEF
jgi:hypothetical protein